MCYCSCQRCVESKASCDSESSVKATMEMHQLAGPSLKSLYLQLRHVSQDFLIAQKWHQVPLPLLEALTIDIDGTCMAFPEVAMLSSKLAGQVKTFATRQLQGPLCLQHWSGRTTTAVLSSSHTSCCLYRREDDLDRPMIRSTRRPLRTHHFATSQEVYCRGNRYKRLGLERSQLTTKMMPATTTTTSPGRGFLIPNVASLDVPARLLIDIDAPNVEHLTARFSIAPDSYLG